MEIQYTAVQVSDHMYRINEGTGVSEYLVIGSRKAMLIDTGFGIGDLKGFIQSLTDLPAAVYITHGHVDHASGAYGFDEVYMNPLDAELQKKQCTLAYRKQMMSSSGFHIRETDFLPEKTDGFRDLNDKDLVDLGDVHVLFIHVPGHTRGSMVPLILEDRTAMFGDASGVGTLLGLENSATVSEYLDALTYMKTYESLYDTILRQHGSCWSPKELLDNNIENCRLILERKDDRIPTKLMGRDCFWARRRTDTGARADGVEGNICYSEEEL
ncbi:MAG TPA: hypothetical protein DCG51_02935 [Erysipelotrichaceae bacterium]|nr:hypothetical protein [Erysipelotrichaceae bacterium]